MKIKIDVYVWNKEHTQILNVKHFIIYKSDVLKLAENEALKMFDIEDKNYEISIYEIII